MFFSRVYCITVLFLLMLPTAVQAQFTFTTNNGAITITGYTGPGGTVAIPQTINGYPVTSVGDDAFYFSVGVTNVIIPNGVTSIGLESFYDCENLIGVTIPNTVTNIGAWAFWSCTSLTTITVPCSVTSVGSFAFLYCVSLSAVYFEGNAPTDGGSIFDNDNGVTVYYLPGTSGWGPTFSGVPAVEETPPDQFTYFTNSDAVSITITGYTGANEAVAIPPDINGYPVTRIGAQAFQNDEVTNIFVPSTITDIGNSAFAGCTGLTSVIIPASVISVGDYAFSPCTNLTAAYFRGNSPPDDGTVFFGDPVTVYFLSGTAGWGGTFGGAPAAEEAATPPYEFSYITNNNSITITGYTGPGGFVVIPDTVNGYSVTGIGQNAFIDDTNLISVTVPDSVTNIQDEAFAGCTDLTTAYFEGNAPRDNGIVFSNDPVTVFYLFGTTGWSTTFGDAPTIEETPPCQFTWVTNGDAVNVTITGYAGPGGSVVIPNTINGYHVTSIGTNAFQYYTSLTNIIIPGGVTSIDLNAFAFCSSLTNVLLPDSVICIGDGSFGDCSSLINFIIPKSVTNIGVDAFEGCTSLGSISVPNTATNIGVAAFLYCTNMTNISVAAGNPDYSSLNGILFDKAQGTLLECPSGLTNGDYSIPDGVVTIAENAFSYCPNLVNITIPGSLTNIVGPPFYDCTALSNICVSTTNSAYSSLNGVLFDKVQETLIQYPEGLTNSSYTIPDSVTSIKGYAFSDCASLVNITIPDGVTNLGYGVFLECSSLASVIIPNGITSIPEQAFAQCSSLASVIIPDSVTNIGPLAFNDCPSLASITIPASVNDIESLAFDSCGNLTSAYFEGNAPFAIGSIFYSDPVATVYYLPGTTGWEPTFGSVPTQLWFQPQPQVLTFEPSFGIQNNQFGFTISWATNATVVVQACTNLSNPVWIPVATNALNSGTSFFTDPSWANYLRRYYRIATP